MVRLIFLPIFVLAIATVLTLADDLSIYSSVSAEAHRISSGSLSVPLDVQQWTKTFETRRQRWLEMIGLSPIPERTPLNATVTGQLDRGDYVEPEANLLVFDGKLPDEDRMRQIDQLLVQRPAVPSIADAFTWAKYQHDAIERLRSSTFRNTKSGTAPKLREFRDDGSDGSGTASTYEFLASDGIAARIRTKQSTDAAQPIAWLVAPAKPRHSRSTPLCSIRQSLRLF